MTSTPRDTATRLLARGSTASGDHAAMLGLVYDELRALAGRMLDRESPAHTLQPTALVHEAWLKLVDCEQLAAGDRDHARRTFLAFGARAMRQVLVSHARGRDADKRGGGWRRVTLSDGVLGRGADVDMVDVEAALAALEQRNERVGRVAELRIFAGMTLVEVAATLRVSPSTVDADWAMARALLSAHLRDNREV